MLNKFLLANITLNIKYSTQLEQLTSHLTLYFYPRFKTDSDVGSEPIMTLSRSRKKVQKRETFFEKST